MSSHTLFSRAVSVLLLADFSGQVLDYVQGVVKDVHAFEALYVIGCQEGTPAIFHDGFKQLVIFGFFGGGNCPFDGAAKWIPAAGLFVRVDHVVIMAQSMTSDKICP